MSDDERREIARRFRDITYEYTDESIVSTYMDALGIEGCLDFVEMAHRIADLIEPSEKVSHVQARVKRVSKASTVTTKICCECGYEFGIERHREYPFEVVLDEIELPNYCPGCGGKVVDAKSAAARLKSAAEDVCSKLENTLNLLEDS